MPRTLRMKSELVPLPAPGAPPSRMNSLGKRIRLRPNSASSSRQIAPKMSCASLTSSSGELVAAGAGAAVPGPCHTPVLSPCIWVRFMRRASIQMVIGTKPNGNALGNLFFATGLSEARPEPGFSLGLTAHRHPPRILARLISAILASVLHFRFAGRITERLIDPGRR